MQATNEIRNILAKGQAKAGANPLAVLDGIMSGDPLEAVAGGIGMGDSSAAYAKMAKLRTETRVVELGRSGNEAYDRLRSAAAQIRKSLITLHEAPTGNPYVAYFNKGIVANPAVVVAELVSTGGGARIELTAFTAKVGHRQAGQAAVDSPAREARDAGESSEAFASSPCIIACERKQPDVLSRPWREGSP